MVEACLSEFGLPRIAVRGGVLLAVLLVAVTIPRFGAILSFVGGLTVNLCTFILPSVFYMRLKRVLPKQEAPIHWWEWPVNGVIVGEFGSHFCYLLQ